MTNAESPGEKLLSGSFSFACPTLICAWVRLYENQLELTGWRLRGRYRRRVPLHRILQVDALDENRLLLWMADGQTLRLHLDDARRWRRAITGQIETT